LKKKLAIIGSGISGLSSAYFLHENYNITLFEKNSRIGGHSRTITIEPLPDKQVDVDTGFIVLNDKTYPELNKLFLELDVAIDKTEMSFAISADNGKLEWSGTSLDSLFAQRKNLLNPSMIMGLFDINKFNKHSLNFAKANSGLTLGELIDQMKLGKWFKNYYILPMGGAIWSCSYKKIMDFPALSFVTFFHNHGLLRIDNRPQWYTPKYKSIDYVSKIQNLIDEVGEIISNITIEKIVRFPDKVLIIDKYDRKHEFDEVVFACHPTDILAILKDPTEVEKKILGKFTKQKNIAFTHCDITHMPINKKCWSSWNYLYDSEGENENVSVTYYMNKLQHIDDKYPVFVTLNPIKEIAKNKIYDQHEFYHPIFDQNAIDGQKNMDKIQGIDRLWYVGAYLNNGFHEDGIVSSINMVKKINEKNKT